MITMRDVARMAEVSITTVSHVVNGTRTVAPETKDRVLKAISETGYTGDAIARSLVTGGTRTLGLAIVPSLYYSELIQAIESEAAQSGLTLLLADTHDETAAEQQAIRALRSRRVDGILLAPSASAARTVIPELRQLRVPTVLVDRLPNFEMDQVGAENVQATAALVRHLADLGHTRIGMVSGIPGLATSDERVRGYRLGLRRAGLRWDPSLVRCGELRADVSAAALDDLLRLPDPPTGVVAGNNTMMVGVLRAVRERGRRIGTDLAVVGYDDVEWADLVDPPLTTMAQPVADIGRTAVRTLLARIDNPDRPPEKVRLHPRLEHRRSCGCTEL